MPAARGLFHRAIMESGAHPRGVPRDLAQRFATRLFEGLGLSPGDVAALQAIPHAELFTRVTAAISAMDDPELPRSRGMLLSPVVDGHFLPAHPFDPASPEGRDVPLIIGTNKDEMAWTLVHAPDAGNLAPGELDRRLRGVFGDRTDAVIEAHRQGQPHASEWELLVSDPVRLPQPGQDRPGGDARGSPRARGCGGRRLGRLRTDGVTRPPRYPSLGPVRRGTPRHHDLRRARAADSGLPEHRLALHCVDVRLS